MPNDDSLTGASLKSGSSLRGLRYFLLLWTLFFLICFGLGYPTLKRYDPRVAPGLSDTYKYYAMTTGENQVGFRDVFRRRVLVPAIARPFFWFAQTYLPMWNPGFFALLVANSLFCATTACLVMSIGTKTFGDSVTALLGATLYLLSFAVPNLLLAGLVDAGEAFFMALLIWTLQGGKWFLLPLLGILGALAKETFVPFATVFAVGWWVMQGGRRRSGWLNRKGRPLIWTAAMAILGLGTVMLVHSQVTGTFAWPWKIAEVAHVKVNYLMALVRALTQSSFWYVFGWLIPLGIWRLGLFPKPWVVATCAAATSAILLGAFINAGGSIGRSVFNISGPLLSLSVALFLTRPPAFFSGGASSDRTAG